MEQIGWAQPPHYTYRREPPSLPYVRLSPHTARTKTPKSIPSLFFHSTSPLQSSIKLAFPRRYEMGVFPSVTGEIPYSKVMFWGFLFPIRNLRFPIKVQLNSQRGSGFVIWVRIFHLYQFGLWWTLTIPMVLWLYSYSTLWRDFPLFVE